MNTYKVSFTGREKGAIVWIGPHVRIVNAHNQGEAERALYDTHDHISNVVCTAIRGPATRTYIGDGVYATWDMGGNVVITTENGIDVTNSITLEPEVLQSLMRYVGYRNP